MTAADHANTVRETAKANIEYIARLTKRAEAAEAERDQLIEQITAGRAAEAELREEWLALKAERDRSAEEGRIAAKRYGEEHERRVAAEAERDHARDALRQYDEAFTAARGSIAFYMGPNARVGVSRQTIAMFTALADASVVARAALGEGT